MPEQLSRKTHPTREGQQFSVFKRIFGGYGELLRIPGTLRYAIGTIVANMPAPLVGMTVTIAVQNIYHSYTLAGALSATQAISTAILQPLFGQLIDRYGQRKVSRPVMCLWLAGALSMVLGLFFRIPPGFLFLIMPLLACIPPWGAMCRARWAYVLAGDTPRTDRALALCGVLDECMWVIGNPLASILAVWSYIGAFAFTAACVLIGAFLFLGAISTEPPSEQQKAREAGLTLKEYRHQLAQALAKKHEIENAQYEQQRAQQHHQRQQKAVNPSADHSAGQSRQGFWDRLSAISPILSPAILALSITWFGLGAFESASSISIIAMSKEQNVQNMTGFIFACFSFSSLVGVTFYGAKQWRSPLWKRFYFCLTILVLGLGSFVFTNQIWQVMIIYLLVGVCQGPTWVNGNQALLRLVPRSQFTETTAVMGAMNAVGGSAGSALGGRLIDLFGSRGGFAAVSILGIGMLLISLCGLKQIREATSNPIVSEVEIS
jgi:MFS family permease